MLGLTEYSIQVKLIKFSYKVSSTPLQLYLRLHIHFTYGLALETVMLIKQLSREFPLAVRLSEIFLGVIKEGYKIICTNQGHHPAVPTSSTVKKHPNVWYSNRFYSE